ncbi:type VII secretion target [Nocardia sp. NPDC127579]|uniref:type VII secretion target n=1 Tax=Nocardia sp. NPDC127579 TaxID=3345402 RepID=UPI003645381F
MTNNLSADTDAVRLFGAQNASIASQIFGVANVDSAASIAAMTPVFGVIGADFLMSFAAAQILQSKDMNELAGKYTDLATSAQTAAQEYLSQDHVNAVHLAVQNNKIF